MIRGISDRATFGRLRESGLQVRSRDLVLRHLSSNDDSEVRVAFTIPRKVGSAVVRNRIRRRIRGVLAERSEEGRRMPEGATVFIIHRGCAELSYPQLRQQVNQMLDRLDDMREGAA